MTKIIKRSSYVSFHVMSKINLYYRLQSFTIDL